MAKELTAITLAATILWLVGVLGWLGLGYAILVLDGNLTVLTFWNIYVPSWWPATYIFAAGLIFILVLPTYILYPLYFRNIEYSVLSKSGNSMPEIYVKKGLLNITKKHVPFRTITNIASRAGPMDRLFGIGTVEIQTAGGSGSQHSQGPEEKLEGIVFFEEVRDYILQTLRKFRAPHTTRKSADSKVYPLAEGTGTVEDEILRTLTEIRDILDTDW